MNPSFREILRILNKHEVDYIVVGGVAAVIHGAPIATFDLDALVRVNEENATRLIDALEELDARYREHQATVRPTAKDVLAGGHLLLMTSAGPLDVLGFVGNNHRYESFPASTTPIDTSAGRIRVLNLDELIRLKRETDRPKDRAVLSLLEEVQRRK